MKFPTLETKRLMLTQIAESDTDAIFDIFSQDVVVKYYDVEVFSDKSEALELIAHFNSRFDASTGIRWGIREKKTNVLIGTCGFNSWKLSTRSAVLGYDIHPNYWLRGFATEALNTILPLAFSGALACGPVSRVQADTVPGNVASEQLLLKLGFVHEGLHKDSGYWKNQYHDLNCYGLLARDFAARRDSLPV